MSICFIFVNLKYLSMETQGSSSPSQVRLVYHIYHRRPRLMSREKANDQFMKTSRFVWLGVKLRGEPLRIWTRYRNSMRNEIWSIYNYKFCSTLRSSSLARKNSDREDFRGANRLRVHKGRNLRVQPWLRLINWNNSNGKPSLKRQRTPETTMYTQDVSKFYWFYV